MKKVILYLVIIPFILFNIYGCWFIVGGAVGAAGFYAVSKDTVQGETDKPYDAVWGAALLVSRMRGAVKEEDITRGYVELETESSRVWIRLVRLSRTTTRLRISARKYHFPNLALAQDLFVRIMGQAK